MAASWLFLNPTRPNRCRRALSTSFDQGCLEMVNFWIGGSPSGAAVDRYTEVDLGAGEGGGGFAFVGGGGCLEGIVCANGLSSSSSSLSITIAFDLGFGGFCLSKGLLSSLSLSKSIDNSLTFTLEGGGRGGEGFLDC